MFRRGSGRRSSGGSLTKPLGNITMTEPTPQPQSMVLKDLEPSLPPAPQPSQPATPPLAPQPQPVPQPKTSTAPRSIIPKGTERVLVVGKYVLMKADIEECDAVVVQGSLDGNIKAKYLVIQRGGCVTGSVVCDEADIAGRFEGQTLVTRQRLCVSSTAKITGKTTYHRLSVHDGAVVTGELIHLPSAPKDGEKDKTTKASSSSAAAAPAPDAGRPTSWETEETTPGVLSENEGDSDTDTASPAPEQDGRGDVAAAAAAAAGDDESAADSRAPATVAVAAEGGGAAKPEVTEGGHE